MRRNSFYLLVAWFMATNFSSLSVAQIPLDFGTFYARAVMGGIEYSENLLALEGQRVEIRGFMAPPLKPRIEWFMLTRFPMLTCPFCSDVADWPPDVILVILQDGRRMNALQHTDPIRVIGILDLGVEMSVEAGLSLIRIYAERVDRLR